ncbi:MAG TPA: sulfite exporter TauE/SafE family protein, partial [Usitatibacter sp.]|nr:sulfite exporter TauE/SafE family protein [Usitatibacter sp.]
MAFSHCLAGFAVGAIVGLTGVGGGSLMTPLLVLGFGVPPVSAVGTDLLFAGITKAGGSVGHAMKGNVDWRVTGLLAAGSVPATGAAIALLAVLPPAGAATRLVVST